MYRAADRNPASRQAMGACSRLERPAVALAVEGDRVAEDELLDLVARVIAAAQFENEFWNAERIGGAPVAGGIHEETFNAVLFDNVGGAFDGEFGDGVNGEAAP